MFSEYLVLSQSFLHEGMQLVDQNAQYLVLFMIFAAVVLATMGASSLLAPSRAIHRRLTDGATAPMGPDGSTGSRRPPSGLSRFMERMAERIAKDEDPATSHQAHRFLQAGLYSKHAVAYFYVWRLALACTFPGAFLFFTPMFSRNYDVQNLMLTALGLAVLGFVAPALYVSRRISRRQLEAREGFPDALEMLLVCVEAGLSLDAAINRVGKEVGSAHPVLGEQFAITALELRAGKGRHDALRNFSDRIGIEEVASLVTLIVQSDLLGTSIAQTLRVYADEMRVNRMLRAEEKAHKLPVKISIPLVFLILPALVIVILSPAVINIVTDLMPILKNTDFSVMNRLGG